MAEIILNEKNFEREVLQSDVPVMVDFWAPWCRPCLMVSPILEEISKEYADKVTITKCNVDDNPELSSKFGIKNIPAVLYFKNGKIVDRQIGAVTKSTYINKLYSL
jgi:thioredoxin 1